jgi:DNA-directed RNA polymerase specialized sigma24 family protein
MTNHAHILLRSSESGIGKRVAIGLVKFHGVALAEIARRAGVSTPAISKIIKRANQ